MMIGGRSNKAIAIIYLIGYSTSMNLVKLLRAQTRTTQQQFAERGGTSQSTVAAYESGSKSPQLKTVERIASAFNLELFTVVHPELTREDRRSLEFHRAIAAVIDRDPDRVRQRAQQNLTKLRRLHPYAERLLERWHLWLTLPSEDLTELMLSRRPVAREMRQVSPFSGVLGPQERAQVVARFRKENVA